MRMRQTKIICVLNKTIDFFSIKLQDFTMGQQLDLMKSPQHESWTQNWIQWQCWTQQWKATKESYTTSSVYVERCSYHLHRHRTAWRYAIARWLTMKINWKVQAPKWNWIASVLVHCAEIYSKPSSTLLMAKIVICVEHKNDLNVLKRWARAKKHLIKIFQLLKRKLHLLIELKEI